MHSTYTITAVLNSRRQHRKEAIGFFPRFEWITHEIRVPYACTTFSDSDEGHPIYICFVSSLPPSDYLLYLGRKPHRRVSPRAPKSRSNSSTRFEEQPPRVVPRSLCLGSHDFSYLK